LTSDISIIDANLAEPAHAAALLELFEHYLRDPMEGGLAMSAQLGRELVPRLRAHPAGCVFLAYHRGDPVGFAICFVGFSTFNARPLINIHDLGVNSAMRGKGVGAAMLERIERKARELGCCRITLEVRADNHPARGLYRKFGFSESSLGGVRQEFWVKPLAPRVD